MMMSTLLASLALTLSTALAFPTDYAVQPRAENPCAQVAAIYEAATNASEVTVLPSLALACLKDVPLDITGNLEWMKSFRPYIEFQTTLAYLKNPGDQYLLPPVDILGSLDDYTTGLSNGVFENQYEFEYALTALISAAHDGHFSYFTTLAFSIFSFWRQDLPSLVSVADAANASLPSVYFLSDLEANGLYTPSPVITIDGEDVVTYLGKLSWFGICQDPDALYNTIFYTKSMSNLPLTVGADPTGLFMGSRGAWWYSGDNTSISFANHSIMSIPSYAVPAVNFTNITSGADLYATYVNVTAPTTASLAPSSFTTTPSSLPDRPGYPKAVSKTPDNLVAGYYLPDSDVAVLAIPSFFTATNGSYFQSAIYDFISNATSSGKTRLIVDLSGNGGGVVYQGYSLFTNLFPDIYPFQTLRTQALAPLKAMGTLVSEAISPYPYNTSANNSQTMTWNGLAGVALDYHEVLNNETQNFNSWSDLFTPHTFNGDNFTSLFQLNFSNPIIPFLTDFDVNGFLSRKDMPHKRPFQNDSDIIILTDGYCASTCSVFVALIQELTNVKTVAVGGRPFENSPMAAVGGTRGENTLELPFLATAANLTYTLALDANSSDAVNMLNQSGVFDIIDGYPLTVGRGIGSINFRDVVFKKDWENGYPAQFRYEAADCRIWYTAASVVSAQSLWEDVASVAWGGGTCAYGSVQGEQVNKSAIGRPWPPR